ncbi:MAG: hypothetical protein WKF33_00440 [Thermoleophilaceae bacterium]
MSVSILWRAILAQAIAVGARFARLLALPLPAALFREQGAWIGPLSWLACALVTARVVGLGSGRAVAAALASGLAAVAAGPVIGHTGAMVTGVLVFGLACAARVRLPSDRGDGDRTRDLRLESPPA